MKTVTNLSEELALILLISSLVELRQMRQKCGRGKDAGELLVWTAYARERAATTIGWRGCRHLHCCDIQRRKILGCHG